MKLRFGRCSVDSDERVLRCAGEIVPLPPKAIEALSVLADHPGRVVSKETLMSALWGDAAVEEANLTQHVYRLRRAFELHEPSVRIETVPRRGYRLVVAPPVYDRAPTRPPSRRAAWLAASTAAMLAAGFSIAVLHARAVPPGIPPSYATGYFRWSNARSTADVQQSVPYFEQAIREEPRSALGYAGLADARLSLALRELDSPHSVVDIRAAFAAAKQGVALDPASPEAHAAFGQAHALFGDPETAERELRRAVELQPDSVEARTWYGELLMSRAQLDGAMTQFRAALSQNSSWTEAADNLAFLSYLRRAYAQSAAYANQSLAQNPDDTMAPMVLALANGQLHRRREAERTLRSIARMPADALSAHALLSYYYARDRDPRAAVAELSLTRRLSQRIGVVRDPSAIVSIAASLAAQRQTDAAYAWLSRVDRESRRLFATDARLDDMRADQRFLAWLKAV